MSTVRTPPVLTDSQRLLAYDRSLALRRARAEVKAGLAQADVPASFLAYVWTTGPVQGMLVLDLLTALPGFGSVKALRVLERAGVKPNRKVRGVGPLQREKLFRQLV